MRELAAEAYEQSVARPRRSPPTAALSTSGLGVANSGGVASPRAVASPLTTTAQHPQRQGARAGAAPGVGARGGRVYPHIGLFLESALAGATPISTLA